MTLPSLLTAAACALALIAAPLAAPLAAQATDEATDETSLVAAVPWAVAEAGALAEQVDRRVAREFLQAAERLPAGEPRTLYRDAEGRWMHPDAYAALSDERRADVQAYEFDATRFYTTKYGTPLAYVRALQLLGEHGLESLSGKRVLDVGSGTLGHLRLMALCGAEATGVDVDPFLRRLYDRPGDHGPLGEGSARLVIGSWPGDAETAVAVGGGYDVFTSKNTLKRGYVHPEREVDPRMTIDLGVDDASYLRAIHDALNPGGLVILFNICPPMAPDDEPYVPWADGRSPWTPEQWREAGFEVLAFDVVDDEPVRTMALTLAWAGTPEEAEAGLFAWYTVVRKPAE